MIRSATIGDLPGILGLMRKLQPKTPYGDIPIDVQSVAQVLGQCVSSAFGFAVVAQHNGEITGFMLGAAQPIWFSKKRQATDFMVHSDRAGDGYFMIKRFMKWAWSVPQVVEITLAQSSGIDIDRTTELYERAGLHRVGSIFTAVRETVAAEEAA